MAIENANFKKLVDAITPFVSIGVGTAVGVANGKVLGRVEGRVDDELVEGDLVTVGLAVAPGPPMNPP